MSGTLQVCLYNCDPDASAEIQSQIHALNFVRLVSESNTPEELAGVLEQTDINLVFFHLDPDPPAVLAQIDFVSQKYPELALVALGHERGPDAILAPIRAGCDQYVCEPIDHSDLANAVARVAFKRFLHRKKSRCVCVAGASGGMGTTSIACNLAIEIASMTEKTCALVDLDLQFGDVAAQFDCEPKYTLHDLAGSAGHVDRAVLESVLTQLSCNVSILPRPEHIDPQEAVSSDVVHHTIEMLASMYETVVVDVPKRIDPVTFAALGQADLILIVCQLLVPSIRNANRFFETLTKLGVLAERIEVVVNRDDSSGSRITKKDLEDLISKPVYARIPNDYHFVAQSLDFGQPIAGEEKNSPVRSQIRALAKQIITESGPAESKDKRRRGFLGRLLSK